MIIFLQATVEGLSLAAIYSLVAIGFVLIYKAMEVLSFAQPALAVGINCTKPELIEGLLNSAKSDKPFVVYPNSGRIWDAEKKQWFGSASTGFDQALIKRWQSSGAEYIGGCCGIGAKEIAELNLN